VQFSQRLHSGLCGFGSGLRQELQICPERIFCHAIGSQFLAWPNAFCSIISNWSSTDFIDALFRVNQLLGKKRQNHMYLALTTWISRHRSPLSLAVNAVSTLPPSLITGWETLTHVPTRLLDRRCRSTRNLTGRCLRRRYRAPRRAIWIFGCEQLTQCVRKRFDLRAGVYPGCASERRHNATLAVAEEDHAPRQLSLESDPHQSGRLPEEGVCLITATRLEGKDFVEIRDQSGERCSANRSVQDQNAHPGRTDGETIPPQRLRRYRQFIK
jgi:hypothetical protein